MQDRSLIAAVKGGDLELVRALVATGQCLDEQDEHGWTPLCWAAGSGLQSIASMLIDGGADATKAGADRRTPYLIALAAGHAELARYLKGYLSTDGFSSGGVQYCKAYQASDLMRFPDWPENLAVELKDHSVVFVHPDYSVTKSIWPGVDVVFRSDSKAWQCFCSEALAFQVPEDTELIPSSSQ